MEKQTRVIKCEEPKCTNKWSGIHIDPSGHIYLCNYHWFIVYTGKKVK